MSSSILSTNGARARVKAQDRRSSSAGFLGQQESASTRVVLRGVAHVRRC